MTVNCIKLVHEMEKTYGWFSEMTVEQLLYAAIKGSDVEDVRYVLDTTDWEAMIN